MLEINLEQIERCSPPYVRISYTFHPLTFLTSILGTSDTVYEYKWLDYNHLDDTNLSNASAEAKAPSCQRKSTTIVKSPPRRDQACLPLRNNLRHNKRRKEDGALYCQAQWPG